MKITKDWNFLLGFCYVECHKSSSALLKIAADSARHYKSPSESVKGEDLDKLLPCLEET